MDMMEVSTEPVVFSHSNAWGAWNHPRNIKDDQIKACAKSGGVVCVMGVGTFVGDNDDTAEGLLKHIDYISELVGPKHVGIGLDYVFGWPHNNPGTSGVFNPKEAHKKATEKASGALNNDVAGNAISGARLQRARLDSAQPRPYFGVQEAVTFAASATLWRSSSVG